MLPPFNINDMIYLPVNTANQTIYLSLDEARQYYATAFTHYLIVLTHEENSTVGDSLAQVATIVNENVRITQLSVTTVGLTLAGRYRYEVYGQNSAVNINPTNAAVVGIVERGYVVLTDNTTWFDVPPSIIPNDIIYEP
jgi:magnesium-transporting ATPase (P-type)